MGWSSILNRNNKKQNKNNNIPQQYCTKTSSLNRVKASFVLSGKVSEILPRIDHVSIFPASYLPNRLDEPRFIVDDLNFLILVKILWTVDCRAVIFNLFFVASLVDFDQRYSAYPTPTYPSDSVSVAKNSKDVTGKTKSARNFIHTLIR